MKASCGAKLNVKEMLHLLNFKDWMCSYISFFIYTILPPCDDKRGNLGSPMILKPSISGIVKQLQCDSKMNTISVSYIKSLSMRFHRPLTFHQRTVITRDLSSGESKKFGS